MQLLFLTGLTIPSFQNVRLWSLNQEHMVWIEKIISLHQSSSSGLSILIHKGIQLQLTIFKIGPKTHENS